LTPIHNKTTQTITTIKKGQRDKRGKRDGIIYNALKTKITIGIKELIIKKNASTPYAPRS
jgi:uncharacterized protein (DUF342 family)